MQWLAENWVWIVVFIAFVGMHMFGHGGRGGHGGHGGCGGRNEPRQPADKDEQGKDRPQGHQH